MKLWIQGIFGAIFLFLAIFIPWLLIAMAQAYWQGH